MKKVQQLKFLKPSPSFKIVKEDFNTLLSDNLLRKAIIFSFLLLSLDLIIIIAVIWKLPPQLPLLYSRPWGEDQLIDRKSFLILPLSCLILIIMNLRLAGVFFKKQVLLSKILVWSSLVICLLTTITFLKIISIVF